MGLVPQKQTVAKTAATAVLSTTGEDGDYTDLQDAITALGTAGGTIYIRRGTYSLGTDTISFPAGGDFRLVGAGCDIVILDFGAGGASLFNPGVAGQRIVIEHLKLQGNDGFNQRVHADAFGAHMIFDNVLVEGFRRLSVVSHANSKATWIHCHLDFTGESGFSIWASSAGDFTGELNWEYVGLTHTVQSTNAMSDKPAWNILNSYIGGGPPDLSTFEAGKLNIQGLRADMSQISTFQGPSHISNFHGTDCRMRFDQSYGSFTGCTEERTQIDIGTGLEVRDCKNIAIANCVFDGGGYNGNDEAIFFLENAPVDSESFTVTGCIFRGWDDEAIRVDETEGLIVNGNYFHSDNGRGFLEISSTDKNFYTNNIGVASSEVDGVNCKIETNIRTITSGPVTLDEFYDVLLVDATAGNVVVNIPWSIQMYQGKKYTVKKIDSSSNKVTLDGYFGETIDGSETQELLTQYASLTIVNSGDDWWII